MAWSLADLHLCAQAVCPRHGSDLVSRAMALRRAVLKAEIQRMALSVARCPVLLSRESEPAGEGGMGCLTGDTLGLGWRW